MHFPRDNGPLDRSGNPPGCGFRGRLVRDSPGIIEILHPKLIERKFSDLLLVYTALFPAGGIGCSLLDFGLSELPLAALGFLLPIVLLVINEPLNRRRR